MSIVTLTGFLVLCIASALCAETVKKSTAQNHTVVVPNTAPNGVSTTSNSGAVPKSETKYDMADRLNWLSASKNRLLIRSGGIAFVLS